MAATKKKRGLSPSIIRDTKSIKATIDAKVLEEANAYSEFVGISTMDETIEKALAYVLGDDPDWAKHKKQIDKDTKSKEVA